MIKREPTNMTNMDGFRQFFWIAAAAALFAGCWSYNIPSQWRTTQHQAPARGGKGLTIPSKAASGKKQKIKSGKWYSLREGFHALFLFRDDLTVSGDGITAAFNKIAQYVFHSFSAWKFKYLMDSARDKAGDTGNVNFRTKMQMAGGGGGCSKKKLSGSALMEHTKEEYKKLNREAADKLKHGLKSLTKIQMAAILHCKYDKYFYYKTLTRNKLRRELRDKVKTRPIGDDSSSCQDQASAAGAD